MNNKLLDKDLQYLVADINLADWGRKEIEVSDSLGSYPFGLGGCDGFWYLQLLV